MTPTPEQPSLGENFVQTVVNFPKYAIEWVVGLIIAILSDLHITTLAVAGAFIGLVANSPEVGLAGFFVLYSLSRVVAFIGQGVAEAGIRVSNATFSALTPRQPVEQVTQVLEVPPS